jgi:polyisoprenoid-binding protein YceI
MTTMLTEQTTAATQRWSVDRAASSVDFAVKTFWGLLTVRGRFDRFDGYYEAGPDGNEIELTIEADSLDTSHVLRDTHLRSEDFFNIVLHPHVRFRSTRVEDAGDGLLRVTGTLEAAGITVPVELDATVQEADGDLEIEATTTVDQRQFGMSSGHLGMIRPPATLHVKARLRGEGR